jgi:hypothetical protein
MEQFKVINLSLDKIFIEKYKFNFDKLEIKNNINILSLSPYNLSNLKIKEDLLKLDFLYSLDYSPEIAKLEIKGNLILSFSNNKDYKTLLKDWENKKINDSFKIQIFNILFKKINLKALNLEEELKLPLHLPFPSIKNQ